MGDMILEALERIGWGDWLPRHRGRYSRILVFDRDTKEPISAIGESISQGGMFVKTSMSVAVDKRLTILIQAKFPIRIHARVVSTTPGGFLCIFTSLSEWAEGQLARWLGSDGGLLAVAGTIN